MLVNALQTAFRAVADPSKAAPMAAYMKNKAIFLGVSAVARRPAQAAVFRAHKAAIADSSVWSAAVRELWGLPHREYKYAAIDLMEFGGRVAVGHLTPDKAMGLAEDLLAECDHWDTLDALSSILGRIMLHMSVEERRRRALTWSADPHLWTRRAAILFQLKYRDKVDRPTLSAVIMATCHEKEFFIRKAIGWALRELSKSDPGWVKAFVIDNSDALSPLSKREALKHIK